MITNTHADMFKNIAKQKHMYFTTQYLAPPKRSLHDSDTYHSVPHLPRKCNFRPILFIQAAKIILYEMDQAGLYLTKLRVLIRICLVCQAEN